MGLLSALRIARSSLSRDRVRTLLTTLGITIGSAAVICTVALGEGSAAAIQQQMAALGDSAVWIQAGSTRTGGVRSGWGGSRTLVAADGAAIVANLPRVKACSPQVTGREQIIAGNQNWNTRYNGVSPAFLTIRRWQVADGGGFTDADIQSAAKVLVIGANVAQELFPDQRAVGQTVRMGRFPFVIIGVLERRGVTTGGLNQDDQVLLPYTTAQKKLNGKTWVDTLVCSTVSASVIPPVSERISALLRARHGLAPDETDDFNLRNPGEMLSVRAGTTKTLAMMLTGVACVSLLVGGIGIMNIMLVSVTERTREIGLRMAVGARERDLALQFLVESLVLGAVGGAAGVLLSVVSAHVMTAAGWPALLSGDSMILAVGCALGIALVFGYYPAARASSLDPIEALRLEA